MIIKLVRHGESLANTGEVKPHEVGDPGIALSETGRLQAAEAGGVIGRDFLLKSLVYCSPYKRARQTTDEILLAAGVSRAIKIYEDPRLREVERGYADDASQHEIRKVHGWFYYRHAGGESPADCYDRTSAFLESLMRQVARKEATNVMVVTHGMTIRCFLMRFLHLTVEQFESLENPANCDIITIAPTDQIRNPVFTSGRWSVEDIRLRA